MLSPQADPSQGIAILFNAHLIARERVPEVLELDQPLQAVSVFNPFLPLAQWQLSTQSGHWRR